MPRVKRGKQHLKHRNYILKRVKGFEGGRKNLIKLAKVAALKAGAYAYRDRRVKKRTARQVWSIRINAAVRPLGTTYSRFISDLKHHSVRLDRKILSTLAANHPSLFAKVVEMVKK